MASEDGDMDCPLCVEEFDIADRSFRPCPCGYQICRFCWHHIKTNLNGQCPACRSIYTDEMVQFVSISREEEMRIKHDKREREQRQTEMKDPNRRHLSNMRVVQKSLVYVLGLAPKYATIENELFKKYGKIVKLVPGKRSTTSSGQGQPKQESVGIYITYARKEDAAKAIAGINGLVYEGKTVRASYGTTKYCTYFLRSIPCPNPSCMYLHEQGSEADSYSKEDLAVGVNSGKLSSTNQPSSSTQSSKRPLKESAIVNKTSTSNMHSGEKPSEEKTPPPTVSSKKAAWAPVPKPSVSLLDVMSESEAQVPKKQVPVVTTETSQKAVTPSPSTSSLDNQEDKSALPAGASWGSGAHRSTLKKVVSEEFGPSLAEAQHIAAPKPLKMSEPMPRAREKRRKTKKTPHDTTPSNEDAPPTNQQVISDKDHLTQEPTRRDETSPLSMALDVETDRPESEQAEEPSGGQSEREEDENLVALETTQPQNVTCDTLDHGHDDDNDNDVPVVEGEGSGEIAIDADTEDISGNIYSVDPLETIERKSALPVKEVKQVQDKTLEAVLEVVPGKDTDAQELEQPVNDQVHPNNSIATMATTPSSMSLLQEHYSPMIHSSPIHPSRSAFPPPPPGFGSAPQDWFTRGFGSLQSQDMDLAASRRLQHSQQMLEASGLFPGLGRPPPGFGISPEFVAKSQSPYMALNRPMMHPRPPPPPPQLSHMSPSTQPSPYPTTRGDFYAQPPPPIHSQQHPYMLPHHPMPHMARHQEFMGMQRPLMPFPSHQPRPMYHHPAHSMAPPMAHDPSGMMPPPHQDSASLQPHLAPQADRQDDRIQSICNDLRALLPNVNITSGPLQDENDGAGSNVAAFHPSPRQPGLGFHPSDLSPHGSHRGYPSF